MQESKKKKKQTGCRTILPPPGSKDLWTGRAGQRQWRFGPPRAALQWPQHHSQIERPSRRSRLAYPAFLTSSSDGGHGRTSRGEEAEAGTLRREETQRKQRRSGGYGTREREQGELPWSYVCCLQPMGESTVYTTKKKKRKRCNFGNRLLPRHGN